MKNFIRLFHQLVFVSVLLSIGTVAGADNAKGNQPMVRMTTTLGTIDIELYEDKAPNTVKNFLEYVESGHFDGLIFHRVIPGFMVQGGGMESGMKERSTRDPIENEADNGLKNTVGTLSMARTNDPHSATSQFFINVADNAFLDHSGKNTQGWGYAVFGKVTDGMDVVNQIVSQPTGSVGHYQDVPNEDIVITKAEIL